jgi:cation diffusion facilitator family transporter
MFASAGVNTLVSKKLYKVARETGSIALEADALHLKADVFTSLGVGTGLLLIWITKLSYLDPIVAILVAVFILKESYELLKTAFSPLLDVKLSDEELEVIKAEMNNHHDLYCNYHDLRTRRSGNVKYIDLHLVVPENMQVKDAHSACDAIEVSLGKKLKNAEVLIHLESCEKACESCSFECH